MRLLVGCPAYKREWVMPWWFAYVEAACARAEIEPSYVFVLDPADVETRQSILAQIALHERTVHIVSVEQPSREDRRDWNEDRFTQMAMLRNEMLASVRHTEPDVFLSIDSDILLNPRALVHSLVHLDQFDAVGMKTYLSQGNRCPNYAQYTGTYGLRRPDFDGMMRVDILMAIKLMSPAAYAIDYVPHRQGEDIGWSLACKDAGLKLGWDGADPSKHAMKREDLTIVDERCGY